MSGFGTRNIHGFKHEEKTGAVIPPIFISSTFAQKSPGEHTGFEYIRTGNPTRDELERVVADMENAKFGVVFSSGSSVTAMLMQTLQPGDHVISVDDVYGGTFRYFTKISSVMGINTTFAETNHTDITKCITERTKMIWIETPTNPTLKLADIAEISKSVKEVNPNILVVVDNTFLSPYFQSPLALGADIVVHSATKYINGHCDVLMGLCMTNNEEVYKKLKFLQNCVGAVPSPFDCYLVSRGIKTLHLRMEQHQKNAMAVARFLESHDFVERVFYSGLESHPQHELAKKQQRGFGGVVSFVLKGNKDNARRFLESTKLFVLAESLGGVESLVELPSIMTHGSVDEQIRIKLGITDTFIRLSCGIEDTKDLIDDLIYALKKSQ